MQRLHTEGCPHCCFMNLLNRHHWSLWTQHEDIYTTSRLVTSPQLIGRPALWCLTWLNGAAHCMWSLLDFSHWCHKTAYFICWTLSCWSMVHFKLLRVGQAPILFVYQCVCVQQMSWWDELNSNTPINIFTMKFPRLRCWLFVWLSRWSINQLIQTSCKDEDHVLVLHYDVKIMCL